MKRKLLLAALCVVGALGMKAQKKIYIETDLTSQFEALTIADNWTTGNGGKAGTVGWACPQVEVNGMAEKKACCEFYQFDCKGTGDVLYQTVTGLTPGTYTIELYGASAFTFNRGFGSTAFTGNLTVDKNSEYTANVSKIEPSETVSTGVTLYAESEGKIYGGEIPICYADNFNGVGGPATVTLEEVVVGESGSVKIGMSKTSTSTNWHVIQLKSVIATVDAEAQLESCIQQAQAALDDEAYAIVTGDERTNLTEAIKVQPEATAAAYKEAIDAIIEATTTFTNAVASYETLAILDAEVAIAKILGVDVSEYETKKFTPEEVPAAVEALKEAEYVQVNADYTQNAASLIPDFAEWEGNMVSNTGEHWDGTTKQDNNPSTYYEQTSAQWGQSSWTNNK
ncbi:MAG: hypothetical protein K2I99_08125, partial [Bacteroidaceae bacterium]|nr:hypothetical protein [Bacteroidaceae bacterium]